MPTKITFSAQKRFSLVLFLCIAKLQVWSDLQSFKLEVTPARGHQRAEAFLLWIISRGYAKNSSRILQVIVSS